MSNIIGVRNNSTIVPYSAATKRTKQVDMASLISVSSGAASISNVVAKGYAYADSLGNWWLNMTGACSVGTPTATIRLAINIGTTFPSGTNASQAISAYDPNSGTNTTRLANTNSGAATFEMFFASAPAAICFSMDVRLAGEPGFAAANMEGVTAVDVYIPPASATAQGLVSKEYKYSGSSYAALSYVSGGRNGNSFSSASVHIERTGSGYHIYVQGTMDIATTSSRTTYPVQNTSFTWPAGTPSLTGLYLGGGMVDAGGQCLPVGAVITITASALYVSWDFIFPSGSSTGGASFGVNFFVPVTA